MAFFTASAQVLGGHDTRSFIFFNTSIQIENRKVQFLFYFTGERWKENVTMDRRKQVVSIGVYNYHLPFVRNQPPPNACHHSFCYENVSRQVNKSVWWNLWMELVLPNESERYHRSHEELSQQPEYPLADHYRHPPITNEMKRFLRMHYPPSRY